MVTTLMLEPNNVGLCDASNAFCVTPIMSIPPVDELSRLRGHVDGLAPQIAQGPREGAEPIHQGRALVDQHEVRPPNDAEPTAHGRGRLEGLGAHLDTEALRGLDQFVEELLGVHGGDDTRRTRRGERRSGPGQNQEAGLT
jgi:hypothetical protein